MLGTVLVIALFALWVSRPWLGARRHLSRRRARVQDWGPPSGEPPAGAEEEAVTLRGRLEADGPILHLPGPEAAAATLQGSPTGDGHLAAEGLRLRRGEATIPIEGRVEVFVGAEEEHPKTVPEKTEYCFAESKLGKVERAKNAPKRAQLRRIPSGTEVIVRGHLERRATDGRQYREGAHGWALVTGKHGEPTQLAAADPRGARLPRQDWFLRTLGLGFLIFVLVPLGLEHGGEWLAEHGNEELRDCDPRGHRWLTAADWVARLEDAFPGFGEAALDQRRGALAGAVNGTRACDISESEAPPGWVDPLVNLARERLPALQEHPWYDSLRNRLEETLHEAGRDRDIVALQEELPRGGEITERVRAHLYLGDLEGALATWEEPGAEMSELEDAVLQRGTLLCMAGRPAEALEAFDTLLAAMADHESTSWLQGALFRDGLCALRAGDIERAERRADELAATEYARGETELLQARIAAERGQLTEWADRDLRGEPAALLVAVALAEAEAWDELLAFLDRSPLNHRFVSGPITRATSGLYTEIFIPSLNTEQLERLAEALEAAAPSLAMADAPPSSAEVVVEPPSEAGEGEPEETRSEAALRRAGEIHRYVAMLHGRRWDPRAEAELDEAERLLGAEAVLPLREALAFLHGDWERTLEAQDPTIRNLSRVYRGEEPEAGFAIEVRAGQPLGLELLHPSRWEAEHAIAALYRSDSGDSWPDGSSLPGARRWQMLQVQELEATWAVLFYRLTHVVVHGAASGRDVRERRAQLTALRELMNAQPDPHLLVGPDGSAEL